MFKSFQKISAYTKMADALDKINLMLLDLYKSLDSGSHPNGMQEEIVGLIFIVRRDIYNPQEEYGWSPLGPIRINSISHNNISLQVAFENIQTNIDKIASFCNEEMKMNIKSILNKGDLYQQLENLPGIIKN